MDGRKLAVPLLAFAGGAILGRVLGLRRLVRGAMTAAVTGIATQPNTIGSNSRQRALSARRRKSTSRKSAKRSAASASRSA